LTGLVNLSVFGRQIFIFETSEELDYFLTFEEVEFYSSI